MMNAENSPISTEQWVMCELTFQSTNKYARPFYDADMEVAFTAQDGTVLVMPGFWDGGDTWKVRFAPTKCGLWQYATACTDTANAGLHNQKGMLSCSAYDGDLEIYKRGFLKVADSGRYFVYDDGTPFFYLGDTHWFMPRERFETSNIPGVASQFKYIVDKRVSQKYTVYQSEPIMFTDRGTPDEATYDLTTFAEEDLGGFRNIDRKFQYIAECGLVHANAEVIFASNLAGEAFTPEYIERLVRYWMARYSAYPVLWTTAQEVDAYGYGGKSIEEPAENHKNWILAAKLTDRFDPYKHPITAHMACQVVDSTFDALPCHRWFGLQWSYERKEQMNFSDFQAQWAFTTKPVVLYESRYDGFWEINYQWTRNQGYTAWLLGMCGHGYGVNGIWNDIYAEHDLGCGLAGRQGWSTESWYEGANSPGSTYMQYMAAFYTSLKWWKLIPRFDDHSWFTPDEGCYYILASDGSDTYVAYFHNPSLVTGALGNMAPGASYSVRWYDVRTGVYTDCSTACASTDGKMEIGNKPDEEDWILLVQKL